jgi:hypothetical protein
MARPTPSLISALRLTADRLEGDVDYQWGHMGCCNCGHLAQTLTKLSRAEIHSAALERAGDWGQQVVDYCPQSGYPLDHIIEKMLEVGLERCDIDQLERLDDPEVLDRIPADRRPLRRNHRDDAVLYMRTMADLLEELRRADEDASSVVPMGRSDISAVEAPSKDVSGGGDSGDERAEEVA